MLDPKYVLSKGELVPFLPIPTYPAQLRVFGLKDRASISRILRQIEKNAKGKKLLIYGQLMFRKILFTQNCFFICNPLQTQTTWSLSYILSF